MTGNWNDLMKAIERYYGAGDPVIDKLNSHAYTTDEFVRIIKQVPGVSVIVNKNGSYRGWEYENPFLDVETVDPAISEINSNVETGTAVTVTAPINTSTHTDPETQWEVVDMEMGAKTAGATAASVGGLVKFKKYIPAAVLLVSTATKIGLTLQPEYWTAHTTDPVLTGLGDIDPETYEKITIQDRELAQEYPDTDFFDGFIRQIVDPVTGEQMAKMYVDEESLAYMIKAIYESGAFDTESEISGEVENVEIQEPLYRFDNPITLTNGNQVLVITPDANSYVTVTPPDSSSYTGQTIITAFSTAPNSSIHELMYRNGEIRQDRDRYLDTQTYQGNTWYCSPFTYFLNNNETSCSVPISALQDDVNDTLRFNNVYIATGFAALFGTASQGGGVEGLSKQSGATFLNIQDGDSINDIIQKMETAYPDMANDKIIQQVIQPDGSVVEYSYVPVPAPTGNPNTEPGEDPYKNPVSGDKTQDDIDISPDEEEEEEVEPITEWVSIQITEPPQPNKDDTGEGSTPAVVIPTGSANALYTVYNPTSAEISSFGAWLWSANFVDQLLKMFNDPMQAIISLHKVFCTPSVSGTNSIKVGYLDSGVSANVVNSQYVTVQCGSVNLAEEYRNVFDYPPYTEVNIYLPFIGFRRLDTNDVMRSTITVVYHIDVLTGACLAEVNVVRDMFGGTLYQFAGDCSVHYPLSSGSYMGIVSALLGVAGAVASGGALAPMMLGVAGGAMGARASIEKSGSLSGNAGAMGIKKPYIVIQKPQTNLADDFETFLGKPSNITVKISECAGFIKCTEVHALNTPATDTELNELISLLKGGVII